jgi:hypothetical protein
MNTYTWEIESLDCIPYEKVVCCIHWRLKGNDGANTSEIYGTQAIEKNEKNPFVNYEELTKNDVIAWLEDAMGINAIAQLKESLTQQLEALANPSVIAFTLPWNKYELQMVNP